MTAKFDILIHLVLFYDNQFIEACALHLHLQVKHKLFVPEGLKNK